MSDRTLTRRRYLLVAGTSAVAGLAGCAGGGDSDGDTDGGGTDGESGSNGGPAETPTPGDATPTSVSADNLTPWWTSHADAERTRSTPDPVPESLERAGAFKLPPAQAGLVEHHPLVTADGLFVFESEYTARYDLASRQQAFNRSLGSGWRFIRDGTVVMVGSNFSLLGLNASSGEREWIASADLSRTQTNTVSPVPGGVVVVEPTGLRVLEAESGEERWSKSGFTLNDQYEVNPPDAGFTAHFPPVHTESNTLFVGRGPHVDALDARTGDRRWRFTRDADFQWEPAPVPFAVRGRTVLVKSPGGLLALDRGDGGVRWKQTSGNEIQVVGKFFAYAVDDTALYVWNGEGKVRALSVEDGSDLWSTAFTGRVRNVSSAVASDGVVYTTANGLRVLSKSTGELRLSTDLEAVGSVVPAGGRLYVSTYSDGAPVIAVYGSS